jgi:hypothetical protein
VSSEGLLKDLRSLHHIGVLVVRLSDHVSMLGLYKYQGSQGTVTVSRGNSNMCNLRGADHVLASSSIVSNIQALPRISLASPEQFEHYDTLFAANG